MSVRVDAEAAGDICLTTTTPALTGSSDAAFSFDLQFNNDTAQDVTVAVAATGPSRLEGRHGADRRDQAASTVVEAGATQNVTVAATAPGHARRARTRSGRRPTAGERTSTADLGDRDHGLVLDDLATPNDLLSASGAAGATTTQDFDITNTGTAPLTEVALTATPPTGWEVTSTPRRLPSIDPEATGDDHRHDHPVGRGGRR